MKNLFGKKNQMIVFTAKGGICCETRIPVWLQNISHRLNKADTEVDTKQRHHTAQSYLQYNATSWSSKRPKHTFEKIKITQQQWHNFDLFAQTNMLIL